MKKKYYRDQIKLGEFTRSVHSCGRAKPFRGHIVILLKKSTISTYDSIGRAGNNEPQTGHK